MKKTLICLTLMMTACISTMIPVVLPTDGPLARQVQRIVARHDAYVGADELLDGPTRGEYLAQSMVVTDMMVNSPAGISADVLVPRLAPIMDRHDSYVTRDLSLDLLTRETYLASTSGLRSFLSQAMPAVPSH